MISGNAILNVILNLMQLFTYIKHWINVLTCLMWVWINILYTHVSQM